MLRDMARQHRIIVRIDKAMTDKVRREIPLMQHRQLILSRASDSAAELELPPASRR